MFEYEFRKISYFSTFEEARSYIPSYAKEYTVFFVKHYRIKEGIVEIKRKLQQEAVYYDKFWFHYVKSLEIPFKDWKRKDHKLFYHLFGLDRNFIIEHRYEHDLPPDAKIYAFKRSDDTCGVVFELENSFDLSPYSSYYNFPERPKNFSFGPVTRKSVAHGIPDHNDYFKAIKYDGIYGFVYSYDNLLWEKWEDNRLRKLPGYTLGKGIIYAAERMPDDCVILLDVLQVRGMQVYRKDVRHILSSYLPSLKQLPPKYHIQNYYEPHETLPTVEWQDGIIYHTFDDKIYKYKPIKTLDLFYENGMLNQTVACPGGIDGRVYECDVNFNILKERRDRFVSNTPKQIRNVLGF